NLSLVIHRISARHRQIPYISSISFQKLRNDVVFWGLGLNKRLSYDKQSHYFNLNSIITGK
ncbi:MAG: hypothetical protein L3J06_07205, partial [Cyclobacteriaceae bacterium]|nr:hypothetical protein [Cyclobacteriaceae bacterium]